MKRISRRLLTGIIGFGSVCSIPYTILATTTSSSERSASDESTQGDNRGIDVSITAPPSVCESSVLVVSLLMHNPHSEVVTDTVTVHALREEVFSEDVSLSEYEEIQRSVSIPIPDGAAGHTGKITAASSTDTVTETISFSPSIVPEITRAHVGEDGHSTITYTVTNTGTAPGSATVTVRLGDELVQTRQVFLGIDSAKQITVEHTSEATGIETVTVLTDSASTTVPVSR